MSLKRINSPKHQDLLCIAWQKFQKSVQLRSPDSTERGLFMQLLRITARLQILCLGIGLQGLSLPSVGIAQTATSAPSVDHGHEVPLEHLYWHFLDYQLFLDKKADALPPSHPD